MLTARVFMSGRSQAVRLPAEFRFSVDEVYIRRDPETGDVVLSARPSLEDTFSQFDACPELKDWKFERKPLPKVDRKLFE